MVDALLDIDEWRTIFSEAVEQPALANTSAVDAPKAVFIGGQPGCGKSTLARNAEAFFGSSNFVTIDVDRLRPLHPAYLGLVSAPATEAIAPSAVQRDCSKWVDSLRSSAVTAKRNMLIDSTMRSPSQVRDAVLEMREAGYVVEAHILAVHEKSSEVSLRQRFEHEKQILGFGRDLPLEYHALATKGIVDTVQTIEDENLFDRLVMHDRQRNVIYENRQDDGHWVRQPDGARVLQEFRNSSYNLVEKLEIARLWGDVVDRMGRRGAGPAEVGPMMARRDEAREIAGGPIVMQGEFNGRIVDADQKTGFVVQKTGRDAAMLTLHDSRVLSRVPQAGEVVSIRYQEGIGQVSERPVERGVRR